MIRSLQVVARLSLVVCAGVVLAVSSIGVPAALAADNERALSAADTLKTLEADLAQRYPGGHVADIGAVQSGEGGRARYWSLDVLYPDAEGRGWREDLLEISSGVITHRQPSPDRYVGADGKTYFPLLPPDIPLQTFPGGQLTSFVDSPVVAEMYYDRMGVWPQGFVLRGQQTLIGTVLVWHVYEEWPRALSPGIDVDAVTGQLLGSSEPNKCGEWPPKPAELHDPQTVPCP